MLLFSISLTKFTFSDKNPYPGCIASTFFYIATLIILSISKNEFLDGPSPIIIVSSAIYPYKVFFSTSVTNANVGIFNYRAV